MINSPSPSFIGLRIGILGHFGNDNLGDEAIVQAVIENFRRRVPGVEILCFSVNPANTALRHGVAAHPVSRHDTKRSAHPSTSTAASVLPRPASSQGLRTFLKSVPGLRSMVLFLRAAASLPLNLLQEARFIRQSRGSLRGLDLLLIAGSNQFLDNFGGVWGFPYSMLKWAWLGRSCGCKVAFVSVGAGPLTSPVSRLFVRLAMRAAHEVSFRDEASRAIAVCAWAGQGARVAPDLAFSLTIPISAGDASFGSKPIVGINPMPVHDSRYWHEANEKAYARYVRELAAFCALVDAAGYPWYFYATQPKDVNVMHDMIGQLKHHGLKSEELAGRIFNPRTVDELVSRLAQTDILVATRFHGVVLSLMAGRPALGVCYHRKTADVLDKIGLGGFHVHIDALDAQAAVGMLRRLDEQREALQEKVREQARVYRAELDEQYELLLNLVPRARRSHAQSPKRAGIADLPS